MSHLKKDSKGKLANTIFYFLNADVSRSKCSIKVKGQAVNLNDLSRFNCNANLKRLKYLELVNQLIDNYKQVKFVNLSKGSLGLFEMSSDFSDMMKDLEISTDQMSFTIRKIMNSAIRN